MAAKRPWPWTARTCAAPRSRSERRMMVAAVEHGSGPGRQVQIGAKTNEIPAVRELSRQLDLAGRVVTVAPCPHETARCLTDCEAHYVVTGVKTIRPFATTSRRSIGARRAGAGAIEKGHGRIDPTLRRPRSGHAEMARTVRICSDAGRPIPRGRVLPHVPRRRRGRPRGTPEPRARPLASGEQGPLRAAATTSLPRLGAEPAAQSGGAEQRRHLHCAHEGRVQVHPPGSPLRRTPAGRPRRHWPGQP